MSRRSNRGSISKRPKRRSKTSARKSAGKASDSGGQVGLPWREHGGSRPGAGRKPKAGRRNVAHVMRPEHKEREPLHVTLRARRGLRAFRGSRMFRCVCRSIRLSCKESFRVVEFSVQNDHLHLMVEAQDKVSLSNGMKGLTIRLAKAINALLKRTGPVWADRYHARALRSPREVRNALVYILHNFKKHLRRASFPAIDAFSTAPWFTGWSRDIPTELVPDQSPPTEPPRTWLLRIGWKRAGPLRFTETPAAG